MKNEHLHEAHNILTHSIWPAASAAGETASLEAARNLITQADADFALAVAEIRGQAWPAEITPALREVLGKPNFWCTPFAEVLRRNGQAIQRKAEDEQAAVLFWLAGLALKHGDGWKDAATAEVKAIRAQSNGETE